MRRRSPKRRTAPSQSQLTLALFLAILTSLTQTCARRFLLCSPHSKVRLHNHCRHQGTRVPALPRLSIPSFTCSPNLHNNPQTHHRQILLQLQPLRKPPRHRRLRIRMTRLSSWRRRTLTQRHSGDVVAYKPILPLRSSPRAPPNASAP